VTGFFANPAGPTGKRFAALGGQGISIVSYSKKQDQAMKFLEWFIKEETQKKWAKLGGYTCSQAVLKSDEFQKATPYNKAFYDTMFMVKDFWATPEYAEVLDQMNQHIYCGRRQGHRAGKRPMTAGTGKRRSEAQSLSESGERPPREPQRRTPGVSGPDHRQTTCNGDKR
jgi:hypothetical protein